MNIERAIKRLKTAGGMIHLYGRRGLVHLLRHNIYQRNDFIRLAIDLDTFVSHRTSPIGLEIRRKDDDTLDHFRAVSPGTVSNNFHVDRLYGASDFFLALWEGEVAHISWVFFRHDYTPDMDLSKDEVEIRHVFTLKPYRGQSVFPAVLSSMLADLRAEDIHTAYAHVRSDSQASLGAFRSLGFRPVRHLSVTRFLGQDIVRERVFSK